MPLFILKRKKTYTPQLMVTKLFLTIKDSFGHNLILNYVLTALHQNTTPVLVEENVLRHKIGKHKIYTKGSNQHSLNIIPLPPSLYDPLSFTTIILCLILKIPNPSPIVPVKIYHLRTNPLLFQFTPNPSL